MPILQPFDLIHVFLDEILYLIILASSLTQPAIHQWSNKLYKLAVYIVGLLTLPSVT